MGHSAATAMISGRKMRFPQLELSYLSHATWSRNAPLHQQIRRGQNISLPLPLYYTCTYPDTTYDANAAERPLPVQQNRDPGIAGTMAVHHNTSSPPDNVPLSLSRWTVEGANPYEWLDVQMIIDTYLVVSLAFWDNLALAGLGVFSSLGIIFVSQWGIVLLIESRRARLALKRLSLARRLTSTEKNKTAAVTEGS